MFALLPIIIILLSLVGIIIFKSIKIVPESKVYIIERLGKYNQSLTPGLHFLNPFFGNL